MDLAAVNNLALVLGNAITAAKYVQSSYASLEKAEVKAKIADLISELADAKVHFAEIREALVERDAEIRALNERLRIRGVMHYEAPYYWKGQGATREGPYCQLCFEKSDLPVHLQPFGGAGHWKCHNCQSDVRDKTYVPGSDVTFVPSRRPFDPYEGR